MIYALTAALNVGSEKPFSRYVFWQANISNKPATNTIAATKAQV